MYIVQIGSYPLTPDKIKGGIEASVYGLTKELIKENNVIVFDMPRHTLSEDYIETLDTLKIYRYASGSSDNFSAARRATDIVKVISSLKPDICHIHGSGYVQTAICILLKLKKIKVTVTIHGLLHTEKKHEWKNKKSLKSLYKYLTLSVSEFLILNLNRSIIVDTKYVENEIINYRKQGKIARIPKIEIIPQGIDEVFFNIDNNSQVENNLLLCVGAIYGRKGQIELIEAFRIVLQQKPDAKLIIAGFISDKTYYNRLLKMIEQFSLTDKVEILTNVAFDELLSFYSNARIFVLHSKEESQGIVLCEAMAAGKPIVTTNSGGIKNVIEQNVNGFMSDFGDVNKFAENILKLMNEEVLYKRICANNRLKSRNYNWKEISIKVLNSYSNRNFENE